MNSHRSKCLPEKYNESTLPSFELPSFCSNQKISNQAIRSVRVLRFIDTSIKNNSRTSTINNNFNSILRQVVYALAMWKQI